MVKLVLLIVQIAMFPLLLVSTSVMMLASLIDHYIQDGDFRDFEQSWRWGMEHLFPGVNSNR